MDKCSITLTYENEKVDIKALNASMVDVATMCGALEQFMAYEAHKRGKSLDDIKDSMLDIHLAAMQQISETIIAEGSD